MLPKEVGYGSLTTLRERLISIGATMIGHGRYVTYQVADVAVSRRMLRRRQLQRLRCR